MREYYLRFNPQFTESKMQFKVLTKGTGLKKLLVYSINFSNHSVRN